MGQVNKILPRLSKNELFWISSLLASNKVLVIYAAETALKQVFLY